MPLKAAKQGESEPAGGVAPSTFVLRAVPEPKDGPLARPPRSPGLPLTLPGVLAPDDATPTPEPGRDAAPSAGTVASPTGEFGPATEPTPGPELPPPPAPATPPACQQSRATALQDAQNAPEHGPLSLEPRPWPPNQSPAPAPAPAPTPEQTHEPSPAPASPPAPAHLTDQVPEPRPPLSLEPQPWPPAAPPTPVPGTFPGPSRESIHTVTPESTDEPPALAPPEESASDPYSAPEWNMAGEDPGPKPAPVREFDAVAEAVLDPEETDGGAPSPFAEPLARINEAVKLGRIEVAAEMAEQTVAQATAALGPQHPEVLRLRELTAYIAYLAGDALRSFHLSLDLARLRHHLRDPRAAYGNIQSAAAAWRAVRDPLQGLHLGRDLIDVWTELAAEAGPAADDLEQLEKARTRMGRLTERARALDADPYTRSPHAHGQ